jgi:hypothetical protein
VKYFALLSLFCATTLSAQTGIPTEFHPDATTLSADALRERLSGKVFGAKLADGNNWRYDFKADGYFYLNAGGYRDSGKWRTEDGKVCFDMRKTGESCNEMRARGDALQTKRASSGEVATLTLQ